MSDSKKTILGVIVLLLVLLSGYWGYRFWLVKFAAGNGSVLAAKSELGAVEKKSLEKNVEIDDGVVQLGEKVTLSFQSSGLVEKIFVKEGVAVQKGTPLVKMETSTLELQKKQLEAVLVQAKSQLTKERTGATDEELNLATQQTKDAKKTSKDVKLAVVDLLKNVYVQSEDAVRAKTNLFFTDPNGANPQLTISVSDAALAQDIQTRRRNLETLLNEWAQKSADLDENTDLKKEIERAEDNVNEVTAFLTQLGRAVGLLTVGGSISQDNLDSWRDAVASAKSNVADAKGELLKANINNSQLSGAYEIALKQKELVKAGSRAEDIVLAQGKVDEVMFQIDLLNEQIKKATINAPINGTVLKIALKEGETAGAGVPVAEMNSFERKIQVDIPEDKIQNINAGSEATVEFKALPGIRSKGHVVSIETKELVKDDDVYYRAFVALDEFSPDLRSGMTADVLLKTGQRNEALVVPENFIFKKGTRSLVVVNNDGKKTEVEVELGRSENGFVEILSGISEDQQLSIPDVTQSTN